MTLSISLALVLFVCLFSITLQLIEFYNLQGYFFLNKCLFFIELKNTDILPVYLYCMFTQ